MKKFLIPKTLVTLVPAAGEERPRLAVFGDKDSKRWGKDVARIEVE